MKTQENGSKMSVNQRLKIFFDSQGLSNSMVAKATDISEPSISRTLSGKSEPHKSSLKKIMDAYPQLNESWLISGQGEMLQDRTTKIDWREEAFTAVKEENSFLKKQLELLSNVVNTMLKQNPNFPASPLQVGKILSINNEGTFAGDYRLAQVG